MVRYGRVNMQLSPDLRLAYGFTIAKIFKDSVAPAKVATPPWSTVIPTGIVHRFQWVILASSVSAEFARFRGAYSFGVAHVTARWLGRRESEAYAFEDGTFL